MASWPMAYRVLADAVLVLHLAFILFVLLGGLLLFRWHKLAWVHVPAFLWGVGIELIGWACPLTYLENHFREKGGDAGIGGSFIEHNLVPLIYPEALFPGGFPRSGFIAMGVLVALVNGVIYWRLWKSRVKAT